MDREKLLLELLQFRNANLLNFCELTRDHLRLNSSDSEEAEPIEALIRKRESILEAIRMGESRTEELAAALLKAGASLSRGTLERMAVLESDRKALLQIIEKQNGELTQRIEITRDKTLQSISSNRRVQGALAKYKSEWANRQAAGEGVDKLR